MVTESKFHHDFIFVLKSDTPVPLSVENPILEVSKYDFGYWWSISDGAKAAVWLWTGHDGRLPH